MNKIVYKVSKGTDMELDFVSDLEHEDLQSAIQEAEELAKQNPGQRYSIMLIHAYRAITGDLVYDGDKVEFV